MSGGAPKPGQLLMLFDGVPPAAPQASIVIFVTPFGTTKFCTAPVQLNCLVIASFMQVAEQPSLLTLLPSSHCSAPIITKPSPHFAVLHITQASLFRSLPSSHCSVPAHTMLSPHLALKHMFVHGSV